MERHGPDPDYPYDRDTDEHIARVVLHTMQSFPYSSYKSHNGNGNGAFSKWVLNVLVALIPLVLIALASLEYSNGRAIAALQVQMAFLLKTQK